MKVEGSVIAISGASSGLGRALALELASRRPSGFLLMARRADALEKVVAELAAKGVKAIAVVTDVEQRESVDAAFSKAEATFGPVDIAVANAGMAVNHNACSPDTDLLVKTFSVNVFGLVHVLHRAIPSMVERGAGQIVGVSSVAGYRGLPGNAAYSSSKAAVSNLMEGYTNELAPKGVEVTLIEPGFVRTEMTARNTFKMPFIMEAHEGAALMAKAIERGKPHLIFPWQMGLFMGAIKAAPRSVFYRLGAVMLKSREAWQADGAEGK